MRILSHLSRRSFLYAAGLGTAAASLSGGLSVSSRAQAQVSKTDAQYQDQPKGIQRCEICLQFRPPNRCHLVEGDISPKGWCQFFAAKENAR